MKYVDTNINGFYKLKKYDRDMNIDDYLNIISEDLAIKIKTYPYIYNELSDDQSYLIIDINNKVLGSLYINNFKDEVDIKIETILNEVQDIKIKKLLINFLARKHENKKKIGIYTNLCEDLTYMLDEYKHSDTLSDSKFNFLYIFNNKYYDYNKKLIMADRH